MAVKYDPAGNRIFKNSSIDGQRKYIVDIVGDLPTIIMELDPTDIDELGNMAIKKLYIHANSQILAQHDGDGAFGLCHQIVSNQFWFTGQWIDFETLQYDLRARQYNPYIGRFTTRDLLAGKFENPLTLHRYLYCGNDPVNWVDTSGLFREYHNTEDTQRIINECTKVVGKGYIEGPLEAFDHPGKYAFRGTGDTFQLGDAFMLDSEFSNYLAGYSTYYHYGLMGEIGTRTWGHIYALGEFGTLDERASRYYLSAGILKAQADRQRDRWHNGWGSWEPLGQPTFIRAKYELMLYGYDRLIDELGAEMSGSDSQFWQQLDNLTTFWNSGRTW
jgi:RHS repeat-associated protein